MREHICQPQYASLPDEMRGLYRTLGIIPTSTVADCVLIRSHIAYHSGCNVAEQVQISPSRGHSYKIEGLWEKVIVRITDYYDHRQGIVGYIDKKVVSA